MNSGLYALAGASATATAAAWAKRLLAPMTKVSKVYFGFSRVASASVMLTSSSGRGRRWPSVSGSAMAGFGRWWAGTLDSWPRTGAGCSPVVGSEWSRSSEESTVTARRTSMPSWDDSALVTWSRTRVSTTSLVKSLGTLTSAVPSRRPASLARRRKARCWAGMPSASRAERVFCQI